MGIADRLSHAWNAFRTPGTSDEDFFQLGAASYGSSYSSSRPDRRLNSSYNNRDIVNSIYNRIAVDVSSILFRHVKLDEQGRFSSIVPSGLNYCLTRKANIDQNAQHFRIDMALTLIQKGHIAVVPVDTTVDPKSGSFDIKTMRVGEVVRWFPRHVRVKLWNDITGQFSEITVSKELCAIVENPFYDVMNEPNSTLQRLIRKLSLLDSIEEQAGSGKLDLIIQLPYAVKSETRAEQAEKRRKGMESQLKDSKYGIAWADATEKITQLNRPAENNMLGSVEFLMDQLHNQLGVTDEILNGTADEKTMLNYQNRLVQPIATAIKESLANAFLTKTAVTQGHSIEFYRDAFSLVPISQIADIADKFSRNEILTSNEIRGILGFAPASDPKADKLENSNMPKEPEDLGELKPVQPDANQPAIEQRKT